MVGIGNGGPRWQMWTREEGEIAPLAGTPVAGEVTAAAAAIIASPAAAVIVDVGRAMIDGRGAGAFGTTAPILAARDSARIAWRRKNSNRIFLRT